jgi:hypothetical protein
VGDPDEEGLLDLPEVESDDMPGSPESDEE